MIERKRLTIHLRTLETSPASDRARGVEQLLIEQHGFISEGGTLLNRINSIAKTNPIYGPATWIAPAVATMAPTNIPRTTAIAIARPTSETAELTAGGLARGSHSR